MGETMAGKLSRELDERMREGFEKGLNGSNPIAESVSKMVRDAGGKINYVKPTEETK